MPMLRKSSRNAHLTRARSTGIVEKLLSDEGEKMRESMGERIRAFAVPDANKLIYRDVLSLIGR